MTDHVVRLTMALDATFTIPDDEFMSMDKRAAAEKFKADLIREMDLDDPIVTIHSFVVEFEVDPPEVPS